MSAETGANDITTGFSNSVELGRIGQIQQSKTVVMHVAIDGDSFGAFAPKLRGVALSTFDGHAWSNSSSKQTILRGSDGHFNLDLPNPGFRVPPGRSIHYRVTMEPFVSEVFFLLSTPQSLAGNYRAVSEDPDGSVFDLDNEHPVGRYEADSRIPTPSAVLLQSNADLNVDRLSADYLRLPALDPRITPLTEKIVTGVKTPRDQANAIESYLRTHYGYTLQLPKAKSSDPVADFLFVRRARQCEHFSSILP